MDGGGEDAGEAWVEEGAPLSAEAAEKQRAVDEIKQRMHTVCPAVSESLLKTRSLVPRLMVTPERSASVDLM